MNKEEAANQEKLAAMSQINPFEFGYKPGTGITVDANLFMGLLEFSQVVARNETKELIEMIRFPMGTQPPQEEPTPNVSVVTTPIGKRSQEIFDTMMNIHFENIDKGLAVSHTAPKLDFGDQPTQEGPHEVPVPDYLQDEPMA